MRLLCKDVSVAFTSEGATTRALDQVSFATGHGEFVSIVGASGCGKTTLLRTIAGLLEPCGGGVERCPDAGDCNSDVLLVFQENSTFPWMRVLENATFGLKMRGVGLEERESEGMRLLKQFGLEGRERSWPAETLRRNAAARGADPGLFVQAGAAADG